MLAEPRRRQILDLVLDREQSVGELVAALGVSQPAVGYWVKGTSRPEGPKREALQALCGIPTADWETADERQKRDDALARIAASDKGAA